MDSDTLGDIANIVWRIGIVAALIASAVRSGMIADGYAQAPWPIRYGIHLTWIALAGAGIAGVSLLLQIPMGRLYEEARWFFLVMGTILLQMAILARVLWLKGRLRMRRLPTRALVPLTGLMAALPLTAWYLDLFARSVPLTLAVCYGPLALYFAIAMCLPQRAY